MAFVRWLLMLMFSIKSMSFMMQRTMRASLMMIRNWQLIGRLGNQFCQKKTSNTQLWRKQLQTTCFRRNGMNILVTGGAGFIGSNFVHHIITQHPDDTVVTLDLLTYAGNRANLHDLMNHDRHHFVHGDINDRSLVGQLLAQHNITHIVNFAAESHVDRSIMAPEVFVQTNVLGTLSLLDAARAHGVIRYVQISTDEVYGSLNQTGYFTEETPLAPNSPYAASKASADLLVRSYYETYQLPVVTTRCSNNYGPYHFPEKLIPLMITNALKGQSLPIYGDGQHVRDWLHVFDHCRAIDLVMRHGRVGQVYNIGGHNERTNNEIVAAIVAHLQVSPSLMTHVADRLGHDRRYAIDATKIHNELGWQPQYSFEQGLRDTIDWYVANEWWWQPLKDRAALTENP